MKVKSVVLTPDSCGITRARVEIFHEGTTYQGEGRDRSSRSAVNSAVHEAMETLAIAIAKTIDIRVTVVF